MPARRSIDLGDGVLCVEFHSKLNTLGEDNIAMIHAGLEETNRNFEAMIIANEGETFSAGANLMLVLLAAQEGEWDDLNLAVQRFQQMNMALKYAAKPVVAAPFSRTLGGGCEIVLHSTRAQASAETYIGLVEVAVGVIPAGGGCKELLARLQRSAANLRADRLREGFHPAPKTRRSSACSHRSDSISMNPERLIFDAKALALSLVPNYSPGAPRSDIKVAGESAYAMHEAGRVVRPPGPLHQRLRCDHRREARARFERRPAHRRADRLRAILARSGARGFLEPVRQSENTGAHAVYAEDGQAAPKLI